MLRAVRGWLVKKLKRFLPPTACHWSLTCPSVNTDVYAPLSVVRCGAELEVSTLGSALKTLMHAREL